MTADVMLPDGAEAASSVALPSRIGKYQIIKRLAVGGMAEIFLARASGIEQFEKLLVLKRMLPQYASDHHFIQMFLDEARLAATLSHPNIAHVYDIGTSSDGAYFFTMEHVHGEDVASILAAARTSSRPVPFEHALSIVIGAAAGLHAAHEKRGSDGRPLGVVHRDVSPSNLLVSYDGCVKVVDFGVAKAASQRTKTQTGTLRGKTRYMAPEQFGREPLDRRSDVFALGILLYELTTGKRPFDADSDAAVMHAILAEDPVPPSKHRDGYPAALERIVIKALQKNRAQRFATAREVQLALEELARERRLVVSQIALGQYMEDLFRDRIGAWRAAHQAGRTLAEHLGRAVAAHGSERQTLDVNSPMHEEPGPSVPVTSPRRGPRRLLVSALALGSAGGLLAFLRPWSPGAQRASPIAAPVGASAPASPIAAPLGATPSSLAPVARPAPRPPAPAVAPSAQMPRPEAKRKARSKRPPPRSAPRSWDPDSFLAPR